ncbi:hypothetical protein [Streptomyces fulvorobeus]|uniref:Uncharacterized protein n=1 Tax=Streptomyces fulvorobeus TaxID=284028 RepID=A0A7J0C8I3_9ACTN|nr:hypothetical protein [Streptomyces fulvorobeus]NYE42382.1 hypothetical protein [Streptomyces fulvorobeus]GFM98779.1 hypothetical protein Sfulv_35900 [Streptomyces fulvorobeus]
MTDTTLAPEVTPVAAPDTDPPPPPPQKPTAEVEHTPGGWPVVPLAVTGTNATTSLMAAAALVGGPAALAVAATGAVVLGTIAATHTRRTKNKPHQTKTKTTKGSGLGKNAGRVSRNASAAAPVGRASGRRGAAGGVPKQSRNGNAGTSKTPGRGGKKTTHGTTGSSTAGSKAGALHRSLHTPRKTPNTPGPRSAPGKSRGRAGQVKALRESARKAAPSRADRRSETAGARRALADARRDAKTAARSASLDRKGPIGRSVTKAAGRVGAAKGSLVDRSRQARDQRTAAKVSAQRDDIRKAPVRKKARKSLWRSAARFQGRRLLAALLAGALGLVGMVSTPLGRKLGWAWLMYPGRRLYARMTRTAQEQRTHRDDAIRAALEDDEVAADAEAAASADQISDTAERPEGLAPAAPTTTASEGEGMSGFRFEEYAAEMESAAQQYEPESAMEILAMVERLPDALTSVANVMRILAERADSEFPLEKDVAEGFSSIFGAVMSAVAVAEDMGPLFRLSHEQDIARHEDPRNGTEAEKGWNV